MTTFIRIALIVALTAMSALVQATEVDTQRLQQRLDGLLQGYVDEGRLAGAVALVMIDGKPVYERAIGWRDREAKTPMRLDTIFRIASQTKAITSAATLRLLEEGKLSLRDPVSRYIPAFRKTTVARLIDGQVITEPARREITVFDLITHTSGMSYGREEWIAQQYDAAGFGNAWYTLDKNEPICATMERLAALPYIAQPGETFVYGYGVDVLGCVLERATGETLDAIVRTRVTAPLRMHDTHFFPPQAQASRLAAVYASDAKQRAVRAPDTAHGQGHLFAGPRRNFQGGAGLVSTAHDYARFLEALRHDGELGGHRILSPRAVALMRTNQIGNRYSSELDYGFGLGFETVERYGALSMAGVGSYGWDGAYGSVYHVDPQAKLTAVLMIQLLPNDIGLDKAQFLDAIYPALR